MKKLVLSVLAVAAFGFTANAQEKEQPTFGFQETNFLLEGNIGVNSTNNKNTDTKTNMFNFNPKVGYFLTDKIVVGAAFSVSNDKTKVNGTTTEKIEGFYGGAFGRYYFLELGKRFKTYAEVGVGYAQVKDDGDKSKGIGAGLNLGLNYFVTENIAISFNLGDIVSYSSVKEDGAKSVKEFDANINVFDNFFNTAKFGISYKF